MITITDKPIDVQKLIDAVSRVEAGAVSVFIGTIRNHAGEKKVIKLEYEAYEPMALAEMQKIVNESSTRWPLISSAVTHRIGTLVPGETAIVVAVSCAHRKQSFEACQFIMDTIKEKVPIWKKEFFEGGKEEWVLPGNAVQK